MVTSMGTITSMDTGASQPLVTNGRGYFEAPLVQPGNYQISVTMTGYNYAAYNNPVTDPTNSNFGKVTTAVASAGAMRFFNFVMRFTF